MFGLFFSLAVVFPMANAAAYCDEDYPYRSLDGTCNNLANDHWGAANTAMPRLISPMNRESGKPNERTVTTTFMSDPDRREFDADLDASERATGTEIERRHLNSYAVIMMQFLSHDISLMPLTTFFQEGAFGITIPDCNEESDVGRIDELCAMTTGRDGKLALQNTLVTRDTNLVMGDDGTLTPLNNVSSYIDLNPVYGSSDETCNTLRSHEGGKLVVGENNGMPRNDPSKKRFTENECDLFGPSNTTHMAGDARVDENFVLTTIHLLLLRTHNRIANELADANPTWDDEKLFQEARKQNIAIFQHIVYDEVLPRFYGMEATKRLLGDYTGYDSSRDASALVEFSTAVFRLHSMVNLPALFLSDSCEMSQGVILEAENPYVKQERTNCDPNDYRRVGHNDIIRGALVQHAQEYDNHVTRTLMNIRIGAPGNVDVQAANIFRGRQHMLGTIDELRIACRMPSVFDGGDGCVSGKELKCFQRLVANMTLAEQMHLMYKHVDNVDPYVGMIGDKHAFAWKGPKWSSSVGELSTIVAMEQFKRIRDGDRFWYENEGMFTKHQLHYIKTVSLSDLLKDTFPGLASEIPKDPLTTMRSKCLEKEC